MTQQLPDVVTQAGTQGDVSSIPETGRRIGRERKFNKSQEFKLIDFARANPKATYVRLARYAHDELGVSCDPATIRVYLVRNDMVPARKLPSEGAGAAGALGKHKGRAPKFSEANEIRMIEYVQANPSATMVEIAEFARQELGISTDRQTIRKHLKRHSISKKPAPKARLAPEARAAAEKHAKQRYGYQARHRVEPAPGRYPSSVTDAEWALVSDLFDHKGAGKHPTADRRVMLDAVLYVVRGGGSWRMLPTEFPKWNNVYATFRRWVRDGVLERMYDRLREMMRERADRAVEPTAAVLDSQTVKTSPQGGPKGYDGGKKVTGRKRHLLVDTLGLLLAVLITPANLHDREVAAPILAIGKEKYPTLQVTFVDAGYTGSRTAAAASQHGIRLDVVKRTQFRNQQWVGPNQLPLFAQESHEFTPFPILPKRWVVERNNAWNERPRRMNRDHDRLPTVSAAWIWLVEARMLLSRLTSSRSGANA